MTDEHRQLLYRLFRYEFQNDTLIIEMGPRDYFLT